MRFCPNLLAVLTFLDMEKVSIFLHTSRNQYSKLMPRSPDDNDSPYTR